MLPARSAAALGYAAVKPAMRRARKLSRASGKTEHGYDEVGYAVRTWPEQRRVIIKGEVVRAEGKEPKDNPSFVITNLKQSPQWIYEHVYCQRGERWPWRSALRPVKPPGLDRNISSKIVKE